MHEEGEEGQEHAEVGDEVPSQIQLASTLLPRIATPSLHSHLHQWNKQAAEGSRGQTPCSVSGSDFRSSFSSSFSSFRPHLITRERPPTSGPPLDRKSALQAGRTFAVIQEGTRGKRRGAASGEVVQIPQSLQVHRRMHGMDVQQSGTICCAMIDAGKNKDLKIPVSQPKDEAAAEAEARRVRELVDSVRAHAEEAQGDDGSRGKQDTEWTQKVEQLLGSYDFFKPLEALSPGLVRKLSREVIYEELTAEAMIFRQGDEPDGCWVIISGCVGVHLWRNSELLDEEVPTPRDAYNPDDFQTRGAPLKHKRRKGRMRSTRTLATLPTHALDEEDEQEAGAASPAPSPSGGRKRPLFSRSRTSDSVASDAKEEAAELPRFRSFEGFSTYSDNSVLGVEVAQLRSGRIFGELALQNTAPRAATIKCVEDSAFLRIPFATYQAVVKEIFEEAKAIQESIRILNTSAFFKDLDRNSPGLIKELAGRGCQKLEERREQVLFRQSDPPRDCYILLEGAVEVWIYKKTKDKSVSLLRKDDCPTPRFQEVLENRPTITEAAKEWKKMQQVEKNKVVKKGKPKNNKFNPWPGEFTRYRTSEGTNTFGKDSKYGKMVVTLKPGAVVGELALRNSEPRAATIRCAENCKFLVIEKDTFLDVLKECLETMRFFNNYLPGLNRLEYTNGIHPCVYFHERTFPPGFEFTIEGIVSSEPAAFFIRNGTVQFQRYKYVSENWAYSYRHTPLAPSRLPDLPGPQQHSTSSRRIQRLLDLQGHASLVCSFKTAVKTASEDAALTASKSLDSLSRPQTGMARSKLVTHEVLKEPNLFCNMPFLPLSIAEPFSVNATTAVNAFHLGGASVEKLPVQLLKSMRDTLFRETGDRTQVLNDMDPFPMPAELRPATSTPTGARDSPFFQIPEG